MCASCQTPAVPEAAPTRRRLLATALATVALAFPPEKASRGNTVEPRLTLPASPGGPPTVALTLDACPGGFDQRIALALIAHAIPATIFLSGTWIRRNEAALGVLRAHPDLFGFGNHGARHLAPVLGSRAVFGVPAAGDLDAIRREVQEGAAAVAACCGTAPAWYRGATGRYSPAAIDAIEALGVRIAGYSLIADQGASLSAGAVAARIARAGDGDVIIGHVNQPTRPSGPGIVAGALELQRRGVRFVRLDAIV